MLVRFRELGALSGVSAVSSSADATEHSRKVFPPAGIASSENCTEYRISMAGGCWAAPDWHRDNPIPNPAANRHKRTIHAIGRTMSSFANRRNVCGWLLSLLPFLFERTPAVCKAGEVPSGLPDNIRNRSLKLPPAFKGFGHGDFVRILQITAYRKTQSKTRDADTERFD